MKMVVALSVILVCIICQSCAKQISPEKIASADYGPPPSNGYETVIKEQFRMRLLDPTSPIYEIGKPS